MKCELCGEDRLKLTLLPLRQPNGKRNTFACDRCMKASSAYCRVHDTVHIGFLDGSTACGSCIEEMTRARIPFAFQMWSSILAVLPPFEKEWLAHICKMSSLMTDDGEEISILRFVASRAARTGQTPEQVLKEINKRRSVEFLLS